MPIALQTETQTERVLQLTVYRRSSLRWSDVGALEKPCSSMTKHKGKGDYRQVEGSLPEYSQLPTETNHTGKKVQNILLGTLVHKIS